MHNNDTLCLQSFVNRYVILKKFKKEKKFFIKLLCVVYRAPFCQFIFLKKYTIISMFSKTHTFDLLNNKLSYKRLLENTRFWWCVVDKRKFFEIREKSKKILVVWIYRELRTALNGKHVTNFVNGLKTTDDQQRKQRRLYLLCALRIEQNNNCTIHRHIHTAKNISP